MGWLGASETWRPWLYLPFFFLHAGRGLEIWWGAPFGWHGWAGIWADMAGWWCGLRPRADG